MPKRHTKPQGDIPYVVPGSVDPDAYEKTSKDQKVARRNWARQNDAYIRQELSRGKSREQLGIRNKKEEGQTRYRTLDMEARQGFQDPNYSYNWDTGMKMNHATSDENVRGKWVPITPRERQEYEAAQARGPMSIEDIYRSNTNAQLRKWAAANAIKGGALRQDDHGFYMSGDQGERIDFDEYGNLIDANTGQPIGDEFYGSGGNITGIISQMGYKSPWSLPGSTPTVPGAPPGTPTGWNPQQPPTYPGQPGGPPPAGTAPPPAAPTARPTGFGGTAKPTITTTSSPMGNAWNASYTRSMPGAGGPARPSASNTGITGGRPMGFGGMSAGEPGQPQVPQPPPGQTQNRMRKRSALAASSAY